LSNYCRQTWEDLRNQKMSTRQIAKKKLDKPK
jgi:hypothetical protein